MYIEVAKRKRTCHYCESSIKARETHFAFYTSGFFCMRQNICVFCLEELIPLLKKSIKDGIKNRRQERFTEKIINEL